MECQKVLALEYGKKNIKINCISPGFIKSVMTDKISDNFKKILEEKISLERFGMPEDVANAVIFFIIKIYQIILQEKQYMLMEACILVDKII